MPNNLTLAVAGSRKTQGIVEACKTEPESTRILVLTYTTANQAELKSRLRLVMGEHPNVEVCGWFSFLIGNFVKPYLPYLFPGKRVQGFDFESPPRRGVALTSYGRYFNSNGSVLKVHLPQLAHRIEEASAKQATQRLSKLYDKIFIDEVQDLCGYDLELLQCLLESEIEINMVGDIRQAVLATNEREAKNRQFMYMGIWNWFLEKERQGKLTITQSHQTWRCRPEIAALADSMFESSWGFNATESLNSTVTEHDGIYFIKSEHIQNYLDTYSPLFLRRTQASGRNLEYSFMNFRLSKGLTRERVLILPTQPIKDFLGRNTVLTSSQATELYVAVTRAKQSVAFVIDEAEVGESQIPFWTPIQ